MDCRMPGSSVHGDSPGQNTRMGCHALLQWIFPTQESNPGLLYCRQILYHLSHKGRPWILEWVAYSFSRESSQPRNQTRVSCIGGRFFTSWATRAAPTSHDHWQITRSKHYLRFSVAFIWKLGFSGKVDVKKVDNHKRIFRSTFL